MNTQGICLLTDFGSTFTKITAVDLEKEDLIGWSQAPTTVDTDITIGFNRALSELEEIYGIDAGNVREAYA